jgi:C1A family cysteine protease
MFSQIKNFFVKLFKRLLPFWFDLTEDEIVGSVNRVYSWIPDLPDPRDWIFADTFGKAVPKYITAAKAPSSVDLRPSLPPVVDQGQLGSCTANAWAGDMGFLEIKASQVFSPLSRLFIYYNERLLEGTVSSDAGAQIRDGVKSLVTYGVCSETEWPYDVTKFSQEPSTIFYISARMHKASSYYRLNTLDDMRSCLASGYAFVLGISVYQSFESDAVKQTGVVSLPIQGEKRLGGHAVLAVGYDDSTQRVLCRNSWGANWGIKGYFTIPYSYLTNPSLASDFWTVVK